VTWAIHIPHRDRSDPLTAVAGAVRHLPAGDREPMRALALQAMARGARTAGDLIDQISAMTPAERRKLLDSARAEAGLPPTAAVDTHREISRVNVPQGLQACHGPGCSAIPTTETGSWRAVRTRRWFCERHRHLATAADLVDRGSGVRLTESGVLVPDAPDDSEQATAESRRRRQQGQRADREKDLAEHEALERGRRDQLRAELPDHLKDTA
jgi:hypothetical protein